MLPGDPATVRIPGGLWWEGEPRREVELRSLTGRDEEALRGLEEGRSRPAWTSVLLERCLERIGPVENPSREVVRSLTVGDREALLLHLRRRTFGDAMPCVLSCPACEEAMDLDLSVGDLLLPAYGHQRRVHDLTVERDGAEARVRFRLPTGEDQEAVAELAREDPEEAADRILARCVEEVEGEEGRQLVEERPADLRDELGEAMERLDPQAEIRLTGSCPSCGHEFSSLLDAATYLADELRQRVRHLYREVHALSLHYHWSEREILALPSPKRRLYLDLLDEALPRR